jgi:hypothetical protein
MLDRRMIHVVRGLAIAWPLLILGDLTAHGGTAFDVIVLNRTQAPGTISGDIFNGLIDSPAIDQSGDVVFQSILQGPDAPISSAVIGTWFGVPNNVRLVAREGFPAPVGGSFQSLSTPAAYGADSVAFHATFSGSGSQADSEWAGPVGSLQLLARAGSAAPGNGIAFGAITGALFNGANYLLSGYALTSLGDATAIWSTSSGSLQLVAINGAQAPGEAAGSLFDEVDNYATLNSSGTVAFASFMTGNGFNLSNSLTIWSGTPGNIAPLVAFGSPAPGTPAEDSFSSFGSPTINNNGRITFAGSLQGGDVSASNSGGIWSGTPGSLALVARAGAAAPGLGGSIAFSSFSYYLLNGANNTAFVASVTGPGVTSADNTGIWSQTAGGLALVMRSGDTALSTPEIESNAMGQIAFEAPIEGAGLPSYADGIWLFDPSAGLLPIAYSGELFQVAPGDFREINVVEMYSGSGGQDGLGTSLNDSGQIAFLAAFTDGSSGIFRADVSVPEPTILPMFVASSWLLRRRRVADEVRG